jgi:hypothetical protein
MKLFRSLIEDFKAFRRGERRVAPRAARGRVYEKRSAASNGGSIVGVKLTPTITIRPSRIYRASTGKWEDVK